ncbi:hypothetical protein MBCUT_18830 [Methanobrevibacter cuticularis]|uniref:Uncharacterized protein n=1 Tax=Methanobrevibacter cuticularis TaxID=47311 RepID=A0A166CT68_9EURY|nr:DUF530 domain-containing protein [Methanobrevibacter cuticularis]KZX14836.1 hypothetical protein MBCUT_18830 [Methanobrevibacter cuticularis]
MDESSLISKTEKYLVKIQNEKIDLESISKLEVFKSVYSRFTYRLDKLQNMKGSMDAKGYTAPYRSLSKYGSNVSGDVAFEELNEVNRHSQYFRMKATAKKNILDRVKSAIDAHKIAIGHLDEYAIFKCKSCSKTYRPSKFFEINERCSCNCENFEFVINHTGVYHLEIIPYLPLSGNYMVLMLELSSWGRESFKKVLNILKQERKGVVKTVSVVIKFMENERWIRKRVALESEHVDNYEEEIRKRYGNNVRIEFLQFHRTKPTIINDKHARTALALGYVKYSEDIINQNKAAILKERIKDVSKLNTYDQIITEVKLEKPNFIEGEESLKEWQELESENRLKKAGFIDKNGKLDQELLRNIGKKRAIEKNIFSDLASTLILWDIFKYYLTTSNDRRKRHGGPFPYLRGDLDRQQRKIFENLNKNVVEILKTMANQKILEVKNMDLLLHKKFNLEKKIKNSNIMINYTALGAAIISSNCNIPISISADTFNVSKDSVKKELKNIETINTPKTNKSKKFLELIKK